MALDRRRQVHSLSALFQQYTNKSLGKHFASKFNHLEKQHGPNNLLLWSRLTVTSESIVQNHYKFSKSSQTAPIDAKQIRKTRTISVASAPLPVLDGVIEPEETTHINGYYDLPLPHPRNLPIVTAKLPPSPRHSLAFPKHCPAVPLHCRISAHVRGVPQTRCSHNTTVSSIIFSTSCSGFFQDSWAISFLIGWGFMVVLCYDFGRCFGILPRRNISAVGSFTSEKKNYNLMSE